MKKDNKGFSLVELIVVIAIMAVLMVVLAPALLRYIEKTRVQKDESAASEILQACKTACGDEKVYEEVAGQSGDVTVTYGDNTEISVSIPAASGTLLKDDVSTTVGSKVKWASKKYAGKEFTVTIHYDSSTQSFTFNQKADGTLKTIAEGFNT